MFSDVVGLVCSLSSATSDRAMHAPYIQCQPCLHARLPFLSAQTLPLLFHRKLNVKSGMALARKIITEMCRLADDTAIGNDGDDGNGINGGDEDDLDRERGVPRASAETSARRDEDADDSDAACGDEDDLQGYRGGESAPTEKSLRRGEDADDSIGAGGDEEDLQGHRGDKRKRFSTESTAQSQPGDGNGDGSKDQESDTPSHQISAAAPPQSVRESPPPTDGDDREVGKPGLELRIDSYRCYVEWLNRGSLGSAVIEGGVEAVLALLTSRVPRRRAKRALQLPTQRHALGDHCGS